MPLSGIETELMSRASIRFHGSNLWAVLGLTPRVHVPKVSAVQDPHQLASQHQLHSFGRGGDVQPAGTVLSD